MNQWLCGTCFQGELKRDEQQKQELTETPEKQQEAPKEKHKHDFVKALILETPFDPDIRKESIWCRTCEICMWSRRLYSPLCVIDLTLNWTLTHSQHTGLSTVIDSNMHFHDHVNANTDITQR